MQDYKFLKIRGALNEASEDAAAPVAAMTAPANLSSARIPAAIVALVPEGVARENLVFPFQFDGETIILAAVDPENIALADRLRFLLAKNVRLVGAAPENVLQAINRHYGQPRKPSADGRFSFSCSACGRVISVRRELSGTKLKCPGCLTVLTVPPPPPAATESADSLLELADSAEFEMADREEPAAAGPLLRMSRGLGKRLLDFRRGVKGVPGEEEKHSKQPGFDPTEPIGGEGMLFYTVEEGQRVLMRRPDGTMEIIVGPRRAWRGWNTFHKMAHFVAHPDEFLIVRFRDGRQEHLPGPVEVWFDPRSHLQINRENALQISAKEAVVVYSRAEGSTAITRRIVYGPALFVPRPGEWLHTFSWHASRGGSKGVQKEPNALVFQKLWLMPDQMYHDVGDVRTSDDAVLTIRLMIFFELVDIERMLDTTHDPIGDFVNAATSDVVAFTGRHDFEQFKRNTGQLNELDSYGQLLNRAAQCGYRINKVVYRGYGAAEALQQMHDQAIEARTRLQLDRATEQQAQDLENYKLDCQLARASKRRSEQVQEVEHDLNLARTRQEAELRQREAALASQRETQKLEAELQLVIRKNQDEEQRQHLEALRAMGVDLTAFLTQARADQVIEFRGQSRPHVHLERLGKSPAGDGQGDVKE
jgi:hypothetical protein